MQRDFLKALKEAGKQVIFVNCSGSCIALEPETNTMRVKPGKYEILVGTSSQDKDLKTLSVELK